MTYQNYRRTFIGILANLTVLFSALFGLALLSEIMVFNGRGDFVGTVHLFLAPIFLFSPRFVYWRYFEKEYSAGFLRLLESFALIIYYSTTAGTVYFYDFPARYVGYDTLAHFTVFFQIAAAFVLIFGFLKNFSDFDSRRKTAIFAAGAVLCLIGGIGWELFQKYGDEIFKTTMFGDANQRIDRDVITDLSANVLGGLAGILFALKKYGGWLAEFKK